MQPRSLFRSFSILFLTCAFALTASAQSIAEGKKAHEQGQYAEAEKIFLKILQEADLSAQQGDDSSAKLVELAALLSQSQDKYAEARKRIAEVYYSCGYAKSGKGDRDGAIADYSHAIEFDSKHAKSYNSRGYMKSGKGDRDGAIADYTRALEIDPNNALAYGNRAAAEASKNNFDAAIADYSRAAEADKTNAKSYENKLLGVYGSYAAAKASSGDNDGAIKLLDRALALSPKNPSLYTNRGIVKANKNDNDGAIADFTRAVEIEAKYAPAFINRGISKLAKNDNDGAIADFTRAVELNPRNKDACNAKLAMAYNGRGIEKIGKRDFEGAIADCTRAIEFDAKFAVAYANRGMAYYGKGKGTEAKQDYETAKKLDPNLKLPEMDVPTGSAADYIAQANAKADGGDYEGALAELNRALVVDAKNPYALLLRGYAKEHFKDYFGALADYGAAAKLDPDNSAKYGFDETIASSSRAIEADPRNSNAYSNRGFAKLYKGEYESAFADFNKAVDLNDKNITAHIYRAVAEANKSLTDAFKTASYNRAKGYASTALVVDSNNAWAYFWRASITRAIGFISIESQSRTETISNPFGEGMSSTQTADENLRQTINARSFEMKADIGKASNLDPKIGEFCDAFPDAVKSVIYRAIDTKGLRKKK